MVPDLLHLLSNSKVEKSVRQRSAKAIEQLADDIDSVQKLAELLSISDIADDIYYTLWVVSHRAHVRVIILNEHTKSKVEIVKWYS